MNEVSRRVARRRGLAVPRGITILFPLANEERRISLIVILQKSNRDGHLGQNIIQYLLGFACLIF